MFLSSSRTFWGPLHENTFENLYFASSSSPQFEQVEFWTSYVHQNLTLFLAFSNFSSKLHFYFLFLEQRGHGIFALLLNSMLWQEAVKMLMSDKFWPASSHWWWFLLFLIFLGFWYAHSLEMRGLWLMEWPNETLQFLLFI